jgi:hypothetical protein
MGNSQSSAAGEAFTALYHALPDDAHDEIDSLCAKGDERLLKPHHAAPTPFPQVPVGVVVQLSHAMAGAALQLVPRLQRKHYEMIPRSLSELDFWISFFSHVTVIAQRHCPEALKAATAREEWKGKRDGDGQSTFDAAWGQLPEAKQKAVAELCRRDSDVLLLAHPKSPSAFPALPLGMECFIDEVAATAALTRVDGLQRKHSMLVPKKLDERSFWINFLSHMTVAVMD